MADSGYSWPGQADPDVTERILRHQAEGLAAQERTDFWGQPLSPADLGLPAKAPRAEESAIARASWPSAADTTSPAAEPAHRSTAPATAKPLSPAQPPSTAKPPGSAQPPSTAKPPGSAQPPSTAKPPSTAQPLGSAKPLGSGGSSAQTAVGDGNRRQDRYFPARLLAVIVIAALIGSALVLLLK